MAVLETKHTRARINVIKNDLLKAVLVFNYISMFAFIAYYVYLIIQNIHNPLYIVIYSLLIVTIAVLFFIEIFIQENKKLLRNEKRQSTEKKRKYKFITKVFKFVANFTLIGVAMYETLSNFNITLSNLINILSFVLLIVQIIFEFVIHNIIKQIDYLRLSIELDIEDSGIFKSILSFMFKEKRMEEKAILAQGGSLHTQIEEKMINEIKEDAKAFEEKDKIRKDQIKNIWKTSRKKKKEH